jgi:hypothetical protein
MYRNFRRAMLTAATIALGFSCVLVYGSSEAQAVCSVAYSNNGATATCSGTDNTTGAGCAFRGPNGVCSKTTTPVLSGVHGGAAVGNTKGSSLSR